MHAPANPPAPEELSALRAALAERDVRIATLEARSAELLQAEQAWRAERDVLQTVLDESPDVILVKDHAGDFLLCNRTVATLYGTTPDAMVGKHDGDFGVPPAQADFFRQNVLGIMARGETEVVYEDSTDASTGETRHFKSIKKPFRGPDGLPRILVIAHDITDVRRAQQRVAESEQRLQYVLEATGEGVWDWDLTTGALKHNQRWYDLLGLEETDLTGTIADFERCLLDEEREELDGVLEAVLRGEQPYHHEHGMRRRDGRVIRVLDRGDVVERAPDGRPLRMVGSFADITREVEARETIQRSLSEKETLLKEVHHRVKNNLQIISSLLSLQADTSADAAARQLLDSAARVRSMALIHQQLYNASDLGHIDLGDYAGTLVRELIGTLGRDADLALEAAPVNLAIEDAVPCGLILNEVLTNAFKHARIEGERLNLSVAIRPTAGGLEVVVRDNGPGFPASFDPERAALGGSLGMSLILSLAQQLRAGVRFDNAPGGRVTLTIPSPGRG